MTKRAKTLACFSLMLIWMAVIFYFSHQPAVRSHEQSSSIVKIIESFIERHVSPAIVKSADFSMSLEGVIRKCAHFASYFLLGIFSALSYSRITKKPFWLALCTGVLYAVSDELHQYFIPGRSCEIRDMLIDSLGALCAAAFFCFIWRKSIEKKHG